MDFGRAFSFPFEDPDWIKKIILTALISLIPILGWLYLMGWMVEILRRVLRKDPTPMPDDINFGGFMSDGLRTFVISFVYSLPLIILFAPLFAVPFTYSGDNGQAYGAEGVLSLLAFCCCGLGVLYGLFVAVITPAAFANFVANNDLSAAFRFGELLNLLRAAPGAYVMVLLGMFVVSIIASIGSAVLIVGAILAGVYGQAVMAHLFAQAYQEAQANRGYGQAAII